MARVKDLWFSEVRDPDNPARKVKRKTKRHPDNGGNKNAKRWLACWEGQDGKECTKAFHAKEPARAYARDQESAVVSGDYIDPKAGKEMVGALGRKWLKLRDVGGSSAAKYETTFRLHVDNAFGKRSVAAVKPSEVLEWLRALAKTHGYPTQMLALMILRGIFDLAVADGMRRDNPARSPIIPTPEADDSEREAWSADRVWSMIDAHTAAYRLIPIVSAGLGLRQGEALGLGLDDFDFDAGKVAIDRQVVKVGRRWVFKLPKGGKARTAPLPSGVARAVEAFIEEYPPRPYVLPWMDERGELAADEHMCKLLFRWYGDDPKTHDQHVRAAAYNDGIWKPALATAGIVPAPEVDGKGHRRYEGSRENGTHILRHYYSTTLLDAGVSLAGVMEFLGHSKKGARLPVTVSTYGHVTEETFEAARTAIDRSLFRLRPVQDHSASGTVTELAGSQ